jgi:hypothetical protein
VHALGLLFHGRAPGAAVVGKTILLQAGDAVPAFARGATPMPIIIGDDRSATSAAASP